VREIEDDTHPEENRNPSEDFDLSFHENTPCGIRTWPLFLGLSLKSVESPVGIP
jgi:hypothetical protein